MVYLSLGINGGCSSTAEHLVVVQAVAGSIPVNHPKKFSLEFLHKTISTQYEI